MDGWMDRQVGIYMQVDRQTDRAVEHTDKDERMASQAQEGWQLTAKGDMILSEVSGGSMVPSML